MSHSPSEPTSRKMATAAPGQSPPQTISHAVPIPKSSKLATDRSTIWIVIIVIGGTALGIITTTSIVVALVTRPPGVMEPTKDPAESVEKPEFLVRQEVPKKELGSAKNDDPTSIARNTPRVEQPRIEVRQGEKQLRFNEIMVDIKSKGGVLSLPKREQGLASPVGEHELCKIFVKNPTDCELNLVTAEVMADGQPRLFLTRGQPRADGVRSWTASVRARNMTLDTLEEMPIGEFTLKDQSLIFEWKQAPDWTSPFGLRYCKLDVKVGSQAIQCHLTKQTIKPLDRLELTQRKASMPVDITAGTLSSVKYLRYDLELHLGDWTQT